MSDVGEIDVRDGCVMVDVRAGSVPLGVVAARTRYGIVRGMGRAFGNGWQDGLHEQVEQFVGRLDPDVVWTFHSYDIPSYIAYGELEGHEPMHPDGVWLFEWANAAQTTTKSVGVRLDGGRNEGRGDVSE